MACERAFFDDAPTPETRSKRGRSPTSREKPLDAFPVVAVSVAYELEIAGLVRLLEAADIPPSRVERDERHPFILAGGPLTFSNPLPLAGIVGRHHRRRGRGAHASRCSPSSKRRAPARSSSTPSRACPTSSSRATRGRAPHGRQGRTTRFPAWAPIRTPHAVLSDMFLIETERGCSRSAPTASCDARLTAACASRRWRRSSGSCPTPTRRVGLVGAAVSDHPKIAEMVNTLADRGREVGSRPCVRIG
jgi:hypothetical protein